MFKKVLIANRGEIAVRVIRACQEMGIGTVAVYSEADRAALHVLRADEARPIGPAPANESYLRIDKLMEAAKATGCDALHPGYGFLAENAGLARACKESGIAFIGPTAEAMELMGNKIEARRTAARAGAPLTPGTRDPVATPEQAAESAAEIGYPVMLKAVAGGGGKGMRLVREENDLAAALRDAQSEARNAFGDGAVYLEKFLENPRHIEIQILGDHHGNLIHLGERECSLQRRHQKVVEEAPSPVMTPALREAMGAAALKIARAAGYTNAGTVEFLVVASAKNPLGFDFYFMEMNTRLQVEHPVTELVTGLDLVKEQVRIAAGEKLPWRQDDIRLSGHAIECRVYAEDPDNNFLPSPGLITELDRPFGPGVRLDGGVYAGWRVPLDYDPLLAKLVCWGADRSEAIARLTRALDEYRIGGIQTNLSFFRRLMTREDFLAGDMDTGLIERMLSREATTGPEPELENEIEDVAAIAAVLMEMSASANPAPRHSAGASRWKQAARADALRGGVRRK